VTYQDDLYLYFMLHTHIHIINIIYTILYIYYTYCSPPLLHQRVEPHQPHEDDPEGDQGHQMGGARAQDGG
jgi:hypothetical protein